MKLNSSERIKWLQVRPGIPLTNVLPNLFRMLRLRSENYSIGYCKIDIAGSSTWKQYSVSDKTINKSLMALFMNN